MISTRGRYALRVLIDVAENSKDDYIPLNEIAARQNISEKYLESILAILTRGGILTSLRGKRGGYKLINSPEEYKIGEILKLTEGSLAPVACLKCEQPNCQNRASCKTLPLWKELNEHIENYLNSKTLKDLL